MTEGEWIRRAQAGDRAAFGHLFAAYKLKAFRTAFLITRDRHLAEDMTQEAFVRAYLQIKRCDPGRPFAPWFFRILINRCRTAVAGRHRHAALDEVPEAATREAGFATVEARAEIWREIQRLAPHYQDVLILRYYQDFAEGAIAEALDLPVGTVKSRLAKARRLLEARLSPALLTDLEGEGALS